MLLKCSVSNPPSSDFSFKAKPSSKQKLQVEAVTSGEDQEALRSGELMPRKSEHQAKLKEEPEIPILISGSLLLPFILDPRRMLQRLHHHAILFRFGLQRL